MECEVYTSESDDSSSPSVNVSRLITEEDLVDSIFYACDVDNRGQVPVSRLLEYLKFTSGQASEVSFTYKTTSSHIKLGIHMHAYAPIPYTFNYYYNYNLV